MRQNSARHFQVAKLFCDKSEASTQVTWPVLTNQRPVNLQSVAWPSQLLAHICQASAKKWWRQPCHDLVCNQGWIFWSKFSIMKNIGRKIKVQGFCLVDFHSNKIHLDWLMNTLSESCWYYCCKNSWEAVMVIWRISTPAKISQIICRLWASNANDPCNSFAIFTRI